VQKGNIKEVLQIEPTVAAWNLGLGESHVLSWCYQNEGYEAILDDGLARKCVLSLGIPMRGTLGIILLAKKEDVLTKLNLL
jgi:predicted nucleic acid-binding protein